MRRFGKGARRGLAWADGIPRHLKVDPVGVKLIWPLAMRGRPRKRSIPDILSRPPKTCSRDQARAPLSTADAPGSDAHAFGTLDFQITESRRATPADSTTGDSSSGLRRLMAGIRGAKSSRVRHHLGRIGADPCFLDARTILRCVSRVRIIYDGCPIVS